MQPRNDVVEERIKRPFPASILEQEEGRKKKKLERGGYIKERKKNIKGHPSPSTKAAEGAREVRELSQVPLVPGSAAHTSRGGAQHRNGAIAYFFYYSFLRYKIKEDAGANQWRAGEKSRWNKWSTPTRARGANDVIKRRTSRASVDSAQLDWSRMCKTWHTNASMRACFVFEYIFTTGLAAPKTSTQVVYQNSVAAVPRTGNRRAICPRYFVDLSVHSESFVHFPPFWMKC